jgi:hypothetical protein
VEEFKENDMEHTVKSAQRQHEKNTWLSESTDSAMKSFRRIKGPSPKAMSIATESEDERALIDEQQNYSSHDFSPEFRFQVFPQ